MTNGSRVVGQSHQKPEGCVVLGSVRTLMVGWASLAEQFPERGRESRLVWCVLQALWPPRSLQLPACGWVALHVIPPLHVGLSLGPALYRAWEWGLWAPVDPLVPEKAVQL